MLLLVKSLMFNLCAAWSWSVCIARLWHQNWRSAAPSLSTLRTVDDKIPRLFEHCSSKESVIALKFLQFSDVQYFLSIVLKFCAMFKLSSVPIEEARSQSSCFWEQSTSRFLDCSPSPKNCSSKESIIAQTFIQFSDIFRNHCIQVLSKTS